jgi:hypothetical protein
MNIRLEFFENNRKSVFSVSAFRTQLLSHLLVYDHLNLDGVSSKIIF